MAWIAVVKQDNEGRITKFLDFATEAGALAHVAKVSDTFPDAFASEAPAGGIRDFRLKPEHLSSKNWSPRSMLSTHGSQTNNN